MSTTSYPEFAPFSLLAFLSGTLIYAFREFYIVLSNVVKADDGLTGYMNYGLWANGPDTVNPSGELVKAVLSTIDPPTVAGKSDAGIPAILEIGCGLGQPAVDAVNHFEFKASITGVSINKGHVARANHLAQSSGLSSSIQHHLLNATEVHTLPQAPFDAAYSVEVLSEIPDPDLSIALRSIHDALVPDAEFVFADVVRRSKGAQQGPGNNSSTLLHLATRVVTKMWGDDWRTLFTLETHLIKAGFEVVSTESIGDRVFAPTWAYAKLRIAQNQSLGMDYATVGWWCWLWAFLARLLTKSTLRGLEMLWQSGEIDYVVIRTRRIDN